MNLKNPVPVLSLTQYKKNLREIPFKNKVLTDQFDRKIEDLRISITDRCNLRCFYCLEPSASFIPKRKLLSINDYTRFCSILSKNAHIQKIRITGGEPTTRKDLDLLIKNIGKMNIKDIAMTTNGTLLNKEKLKKWFDYGLNRITFSLDSLKDEKSKIITRRPYSPKTVIKAIKNAQEVGFKNIKVNTVIIKGANDDEINSFCNLSKELSIDIRFLEFMPLDEGKRWEKNSVFTANEIEQILFKRTDLSKIGRDSPSSTSEMWKFNHNTKGRIGLIAPVSRPFCGKCNRLRLTADGNIRACLFSNEEWDIFPLLKNQASDKDIIKIVYNAVYHKKKKHQIGQDDFIYPSRAMNRIGG
tara:strand:- start:36 stop:1106 length:1071 start_codon:yes stop_codon:yes gene_type:complete